MTAADRFMLQAYVSLEAAEELLDAKSTKGQQVHAARGVLEIGLHKVFEELDAKRREKSAGGHRRD